MVYTKAKKIIIRQHDTATPGKQHKNKNKPHEKYQIHVKEIMLSSWKM